MQFMNYGRKISAKYVLAYIFTLLFFAVTLSSPAKYAFVSQFGKILTAPHTASNLHPGASANDTVIKGAAGEARDSIPRGSTAPAAPLAKDTVIKDSATKTKDSLARDTAGRITDTLSFRVSKDSLDAPISYTALDSVVLDVPTKQLSLYNKATTKYKDIELDAYKVVLDQPKDVIVATYTKDTSNQMQGQPKMIEKQTTMLSDSITYNLKTQKGITVNTYTQSGEMYVMGERMKKISPAVYYAYRGRFTTCNLDTPHFAFRTNKLKLITDKMAITGPVHPEFEGVPVPIYLPFGFFPITEGRHSGLLPPSFTSSQLYGIGLQGLGYYKVLSDNFDVILRTDLWSYGGWAIYATPEYKVRYRFQGRMNFTYENVQTLSNTGQSEYVSSKLFQLNWTHTVDSKARPGQNFAASVNISSQHFNQFVQNNPTANFTNQLSSSINYSKTWDQKYNLNINASHTQNNQSGVININFPSVNFTAITFYPLQKKEFVGAPKWYEKLGIGLNTTIVGQTATYDSTFSFKSLLDTFQWGAQNSIPITLSLPSLFGGALQISPAVSLQNRLYSKYTIMTYDPVAEKLDTAQFKGFYSANYLSLGLNLSTAIFGTFDKFGKNSSVLGIRHVIRPTLGISYSPNLQTHNYYTSRADTTQNLYTFSKFAQSPYGAFPQGTFGGVNFGLDNNFEMKVRSKSDTSETGTKKVKLIDGIGFTGSYNYLADSFKLSPFSLYLRSTLFGNLNITGGATLDPYVYDSTGLRHNIYAWNDPGHKFSVGKITQGNIALSTSFKSKPKDAKKAEQDKQQALDQIPMTVEEQQAQLDYIRANPGEFADFNIAWSVNVSYSLSYSVSYIPYYNGFYTVYKSTANLNSSLTLGADFNLTDKWKAGFNTYYDLKSLQVQSLTAFVSRDLHCWQMSINVTPVGPWRSYSITLSPKSALLRDLKINRSRSFYN
jgi:LPS-assembly protein